MKTLSLAALVLAGVLIVPTGHAAESTDADAALAKKTSLARSGIATSEKQAEPSASIPAAPSTPISAVSPPPQKQTAPVITSVARANVPPPPDLKRYKEGECPLTKDNGVWHTPDGKPVDEATAKMGDCRGH